jgi:hypothetical protein
MNTAVLVFLLSLASLFSQQTFASVPPAPPRVSVDLNLTPGILCSPSDPNFSGLDYPEKIARCNRNIPTGEKLKVAAAYGNIPQSDWPKYEFDHLLPLCAGGSDDSRNLWPQPIAQAHEKDKLEVQICIAMKAGTMTQAVAVQKVYDWFRSNGMAVPPQANPPVATDDPQSVTCTSAQVPSLVARFRVVDDTHLDGISLALNDNGDHEIISAIGSTNGVHPRTNRSPLGGLVRYTVASAGGNDRFDLYTPKNIESARSPSFNVFVKISFEGTYPNLSTLACTYDVAP